ncbi:uncharacterized protein LOC127717276 [Mytilus californianus]|uniref:uncharacterized protein LOC127717276 n=1 Tax=Mytilus californianus TaxID=6549 RepID=UPI002246D896|nr:uncharacterized protein LOC127717276 [Mytilus californianus]
MQYQSFKQTKMENLASCISTLLYTNIYPDTMKLAIDEVQTGRSFPDKMSSKINGELTCISLTNFGSLDEEKIQTKHPSTQTKKTSSEICSNKTITDTKTTNIHHFRIGKQLESTGIFEDTYKIFSSESLPSSTVASHVIRFVVSRVDIKHRSIMRKCFLDNERCVFEKDVSNPLRYLETLLQFIQTPVNQGNITTCNMTKIYDQYVAFAAFTIDDLTNKTNDIDPESNLFNDIEAIASKTSCPDVTLCMLYGRKAVAYSFKKKKAEGENMRNKALMCAENVGPCLEKVDMLYKLVLFSRAWYEHNPDEELAFILEYTKQALDILAAIYLGDDQRSLWQQRFEVRLLFCYVGIGMRGKFISTYKLKSTHENEANKLLDLLNASDLNRRLQMLVNVAKSRLYQLNSEFEEAIFYNKKAKIIAIEKNYCEREEIRTNAKKLRRHYIKNA